MSDSSVPLRQCGRLLRELTVFRSILKDDVIRAFIALCEKPNYYRYAMLWSRLFPRAESLGFKGDALREYFIYLFLNDVNNFSLAYEKNISVNPSSTLYRMALRDAENLYMICRYDQEDLNARMGGLEGELPKELTGYTPLIHREDEFLNAVSSAETPEDMLMALTWRYQKLGAGEIGTCTLFRMGKEGVLEGIKEAEPFLIEQIIGYDTQKELLFNNTDNFLAGLPANNVLLAGSRGNGKSSCIKSLADKYGEMGLRLIEMQKHQLNELPGLLRKLEQRGKYFIIFMDDLSYEDFETDYKYLKSLLEGGFSAQPKNVLFYATSNRRHIVRENWKDRKEQDEEIHITDAMHEKLSLFDRFGITIHFPNMTQEEYLAVVRGLAEQQGLSLSLEMLNEKAAQWVLNQRSVSGRTARQFVSYITGEMLRLNN